MESHCFNLHSQNINEVEPWFIGYGHLKYSVMFLIHRVASFLLDWMNASVVFLLYKLLGIPSLVVHPFSVLCCKFLLPIVACHCVL